MSRADEIFVANMKEILETGFSDEKLPVRPHWEDGTPAHTIKKFCIVNRYNLQEELPILTIRRTAFKLCLDELLWIWQKKSNNIHDLNSHIWDSWADETGSIGKAYGYQLGVKHHYPEGDFVDSQGNKLGTHRGIINYTIGQRKGLGIASTSPYYVCKICTEKNEVVLGRNDELFTKTAHIKNVNWIRIIKSMTGLLMIY